MQFVTLKTLRRGSELPPIIENSEALRNLAGLKEELANKKISEAELSRRSKIKASSIALYVRNKKLPGITDYNKLAGVFDWKILTATGTEESALKAERESVRAKFIVGKSYKIDSANGCVFRYEGKQGIHHIFREVRGNWTRTYTDAQLIGAKTEEVKE